MTARRLVWAVVEGRADAPQRLDPGLPRRRRLPPRLDRRPPAARTRQADRRHDAAGHGCDEEDSWRAHDTHSSTRCMPRARPPTAPARWTLYGQFVGSWDLDVTEYRRRRHHAPPSAANGISAGRWKAAPSRTSGSCRRAGNVDGDATAQQQPLWHDIARLRSAPSTPGTSSGPSRSAQTYLSMIGRAGRRRHRAARPQCRRRTMIALGLLRDQAGLVPLARRSCRRTAKRAGNGWWNSRARRR